MIKNLAELFLKAVETFGERSILEWKEGGEYKSLSGRGLLETVNNVSASFEKLGLEPNSKAAIISESRYEWMVTDFACIFNRVVTVPIYTTMTSEQIEYILRHSGCEVCFVSSNLILEKVKSVMHSLPEMRRIVVFSEAEGNTDYIMRFETLMSARRSDATGLHEKMKAINENDLLTIIYTSGTTGIPKGVCLTHKNIISNIRSCREALYVDEDDVFLSFLPLAHSYERTTAYYFPLFVGAKVVYAQSIDTIAAQMPEVKPTVMTAVPLFLHRMHARVSQRAETMPWIRKVIFEMGLKVAEKYGNKGDETHPALRAPLRRRGLVWKLFDLLVYKKLRKRLGGRLRFFVSGGSALNKDTGEFFDSMGIKILEGYGMTEASPVISVNREENYRFGTVGLPLNGVTVRIAEDGEILVKGGNVMTGYYKDEKETKEIIRDGWLHTGDIGEIDSEGRLKITDRKKTLFKTEGGKYISLTHIEEAIVRSRFIEQILALGGDKPFVTALVTPAFDELKSYAVETRLQYRDNKDLVAHPEILKLMRREIDEKQTMLAKHERVRRFTLLPEPFSIEGGELTPTLKVRRKIVEEKYKVLIEEMYGSK
jgi:long-chain acyl-CoA synthetase